MQQRALRNSGWVLTALLLLAVTRFLLPDPADSGLASDTPAEFADETPAHPRRISESDLQARIAAIRGEQRPGDNSPQRQRERLEFEQVLQRSRQNRDRIWPGLTIRSAADYAQMPTIELFDECFATPLLATETTGFNDPQLGVLRLRTLHDGFAEIFRRTDLVDGLEHLLHRLAERIETQRDRQTVLNASLTAGSLHHLYGLPEFRRQIEREEPRLAAALVNLLRSYQRGMSRAEPAAGPAPFTGDCVNVAISAIAFMKSSDPVRSRTAAHALQQFSFPRASNTADLRRFLDGMLAALAAAP